MVILMLILVFYFTQIEVTYIELKSNSPKFVVTEFDDTMKDFSKKKEIS